MSISDKTYGSPFTMEQIETINPVSTPESELIYYLVCGETVVNYSTGARYQRNDYIYGKFALLNGAKDEVDLRGIVIYRDYDTPPLADGVSDGYYYELLQTNKGNDIAGVIGTETQLASIQSNYTGAYTDLNTSKFIANDYHGLLAAGPWNTIGLHYADVRSQEDLTSFIVINQNPTEETYHYQYVSRGSVISQGDLVIGATPTPPANPAAYESGNYRYTFNRWELSMSGKDHTYTAVFTSTRIVITVIWQNWNGTELQRKTYNKGDSEPSYSGSTPTRPNDTNYSYTFSSWVLVSSSTYSKTYKAQYTSKPLAYTWNRYSIGYTYTERSNGSGTRNEHGNNPVTYWFSKPAIVLDGEEYGYDYRNRDGEYIVNGAKINGRYIGFDSYTGFIDAIYLASGDPTLSHQYDFSIPYSASYFISNIETSGTFLNTVTSTDPDKYPLNGKHIDGYWYIRQ